MIVMVASRRRVLKMIRLGFVRSRLALEDPLRRVTLQLRRMAISRSLSTALVSHFPKLDDSFTLRRLG